MRLISRTLNQIRSPIDLASALKKQYQGDRPLLDLTQGELNYPTAPTIVNHVASVASDPVGSKYTSRPGLDRLRDLVAEDVSLTCNGIVKSNQVFITAGCNQAFCLAVSALAEHGDEVILPVPYYFNHDMWLRLDHISPIYHQTSPNFIPDPSAVEGLITGKTRAIVLVTPGNPTGITIPPAVIHSFADLARKYNIMLILDETYRAFRDANEPAHGLFEQQSWEDNIISLHSFSKEFAIPGYRVGAVICHSDLLAEIGKLFDCLAICAPRIGQEAVIAALTSAKDWRNDRVLEILERQTKFKSIFLDRPGGFELCAAGAFYGWVRHSVARETTDQVVRRLLLSHGILVLPGTVFTPTDNRFLRFSFANTTIDEIDELGERLSKFV